ncbi:MAG: carboxymuconolactone decarboxylase family protein [Candidatus Poribacteria bacterium]|nr:carboxymuconolactone decarboxylase family protein [Candidatus Poribacteria bacterium]
MAWIQTVDETDATGIVKEEYDAAMARAGEIYNIVKLFSVRPKSMRAFVELYLAVMFDEDSPLTRMQREMIATVVSKVNECDY